MSFHRSSCRQLSQMRNRSAEEFASCSSETNRSAHSNLKPQTGKQCSIKSYFFGPVSPAASSWSLPMTGAKTRTENDFPSDEEAAPFANQWFTYIKS
jgi:hypothetical protein